MAIPWRTLLMGLPKQRFSPAELQRTIPERPGTALCVAAVLNALMLAGAVVITAGATSPVRVSLVLLPYIALHLWALWWVWADPGSRWGRLTYYLAPLALGVCVGLARDVLGVDQNKSIVIAIAIAAMVLSLALWFAIVYRHKFVELRLKELEERDRAVDMARQLAAAQIQPHFLFNSLASLQHWVQAKDDRAAPLLDALTGYLRATLPLFNREQLALGDEAVAVERYLQVMQMRLGDKLRFTIDLPPSTHQAQVPPGLLLTLVENAIEHGVLPHLQPVEVHVRARQDGQRLTLEVADDGAGYDARATPAIQRGIGLDNVRQRLSRAHGPAAGLTLSGAPGAGCTARIELPMVTAPATVTPHASVTAHTLP